MTTATGSSQVRMEGIVELQPVIADADAGPGIDPQHTMRLRVERIERAADKVLFLTLVELLGRVASAPGEGAEQGAESLLSTTAPVARQILVKIAVRDIGQLTDLEVCPG